MDYMRLMDTVKSFLKKKPALFLALLVLVILFIINFFLKEHSLAQKNEIETRLKELERMQGGKEIADLKKATEELNHLKQTLESKLFNFSESTQFIAFLLSFEAKNKVKIENPTLTEKYNLTKKTREEKQASSPSPSDLYALTYDLQLKGEYKNILGYIHQLQEGSKAWIIIEKLRISKANHFINQSQAPKGNVAAETFKESLKAYEAQQILQANLTFKVLGCFQ